MNRTGLISRPFLITSKCTCGPVERPEEPISAILKPFSTVSPTETRIFELCKNMKTLYKCKNNNLIKLKTFWKLSNFYFCHNVFKSRLLHMYQKASICGKGLMKLRKLNCDLLVMNLWKHYVIVFYFNSFPNTTNLQQIIENISEKIWKISVNEIITRICSPIAVIGSSVHSGQSSCEDSGSKNS